MLLLMLLMVMVIEASGDDVPYTFCSTQRYVSCVFNFVNGGSIFTIGELSIAALHLSPWSAIVNGQTL